MPDSSCANTRRLPPHLDVSHRLSLSSSTYCKLCCYRETTIGQARIGMKSAVWVSIPYIKVVSRAARSSRMMMMVVRLPRCGYKHGSRRFMLLLNKGACSASGLVLQYIDVAVKYKRAEQDLSGTNSQNTTKPCSCQSSLWVRQSVFHSCRQTRIISYSSAQGRMVSRGWLRRTSRPMT